MDYYVGSNLYSSDALQHYGILGMKWGVRRTPEELGYPTKHHGKSINVKKNKRILKSKNRSNKKNPPTHEEILKSKDPKTIYKYRDQLSDQELNRIINRMNREQELKKKAWPDSQGKKLVRTLLTSSGTLLVGYIISKEKSVLIPAGEQYVKRLFRKVGNKLIPVFNYPLY